VVAATDGGGGATVVATVVGATVVGATVVGAGVVVGATVVVVDVVLRTIGSGVPPSSSSARIVPVVTAAASATAPVNPTRKVHLGRRVGRIARSPCAPTARRAAGVGVGDNDQARR
jgi:hypothetical protein